LGKGFFYTEYLFKKYFEILSTQGHQGNAHNSYLTFWLDTGLIGLIMYVVAFFSSFISAARKSYYAIPLLYAIVFSANFESWLTSSLNPFTIQVWIMLTILLFMSDLQKEQTIGTEISESL
jgi:O-antigen ligase